MASPSPYWWTLWLVTVATTTIHAGSFSFDNDLTLTVPEGFEVTLVAGPPLIDRPVMADFDHEGRLYVAEASGTNDDVETQLRDKPHRIVCLEDRDDDGHYDHKVVFADQLMLPEGVLCYRGAVYVSAPPVIWKLTDTDADGVCDQREVWHDGKTLTGCANDLHGPYLGRDGWIYWCKGAFAEQTYPQPGKPPLVSRAAHIFRKHPHGDVVEAVMTGGMDNPVELAFSPEGERFFTTTFLQHPGAGRRDGIIHAIYGGVYGKEHDVLVGHPRTGDLMPVMTHLGPAAACGLMLYESSALGESYQGNLFATEFNMRKITRHQRHSEGSTFTTKDTDFLVANQMDFHPTDVLEDGDGSLLVIDTGGWYKLCCPTSQLHKPQALGAIYRVRCTDDETPPDPYGRLIAWERSSPQDLVALLGDERHLVRKRAIDELALHAEPSVTALAAVLADTNFKAETARDAVWALTRIDSPTARLAVQSALTHLSPQVRQAALHSISVRKDHESLLTPLLDDPEASIRRAAAEAIGRTADSSACKHLLDTLSEPHDRTLEHSLIYALIEIGDSNALKEAFNRTEAPAIRASLIALDQLGSIGLSARDVLPLLDHTDIALKNTAWAIAIKHPEWSQDFLPVLREALPTAQANGPLTALLASWMTASAIQELVTDALQSEQRSQRQLASQAIIDSKLTELPIPWHASLAQLLETSPEVALAILAKFPLAKEHVWAQELHPPLQRMSANENALPGIRLQALRLVVPPQGTLESSPFQWTLTQLSSDQPPEHRSQALAILTKLTTTASQQTALAEALAGVGPMEFGKLTQLLLPQLSNLDTAQAMVASLKANPIVPTLPPATLHPILEALPESLNLEKSALAERFLTGASEQASKLEALLEELPAGNVARGQTIFNGNRAACATCHEIGYLGGKLGPDLTTIGTIRSRRDLLEAIVFPSASFVRSYEPVLVNLKGDQQLLGILKQDNGQQITLATGPTTEAIAKRQDILSMIPATISLMPPGLDTILTQAELGDLLAFLENTKWR